MTTNTFNFTFTVDSQTEVVPKTYAGSQPLFLPLCSSVEDAMLYLEGERLRRKGIEAAKIRGTNMDRYF